MRRLLICYGASALGCFFLCFPLLRFLRQAGIIDLPNERSSHAHPTVRGGGIAIITIILFVVTGEYLWSGWGGFGILFLATAGLAIVSFFDDLYSLTPLIRFVCQSAGAVGALWSLQWPAMTLDLNSGSGVAIPSILSLLLCFLWITGYTNAFNFMDGINGLAASQALLTALGSIFLVALAGERWSNPLLLLLAAIAGASTGFLPHNFPNARMFMGDVGSAPLGFLLAVLTVWIAANYGWSLLLPMLLLHANFILDTGITLLRRISHREKWYQAHREHFYQRLLRSGKSHAFVTGLEMAIQTGVLAGMILYLRADWWARLLLATLVILAWGCFFIYAEKRLRLANPCKSLCEG